MTRKFRLGLELSRPHVAPTAPNALDRNETQEYDDECRRNKQNLYLFYIVELAVRKMSSIPVNVPNSPFAHVESCVENFLMQTCSVGGIQPYPEYPYIKTNE